MNSHNAFAPATGYVTTRYSVALSAVAANSGSPIAQIRAGSVPLLLRMIGLTTKAATATYVGLVRPATSGTSDGSTDRYGQSNLLDTVPQVTQSSGLIVAAWSSAPTIAATPVYYAKAPLPPSQGASVLWTWDVPVEIVSGSSFLLWNYGGSACAATDISVEFDEVVPQ